jgi:hypothetical protein
MTRDELRTIYPNASQNFLDLNSGPVAVVERDTGDGALDSQEIQRRLGERVLVRLTAVRTRLLDEDNCCEKYHVDLLRYAGIIFDDSPGQTKIEVCQIKAGKGEREEVRLEVFKI